MKNKSRLNMTAVHNAAALDKKADLEKMMKSNNFADVLRFEVTSLYLINNLRLIISKN